MNLIDHIALYYLMKKKRRSIKNVDVKKPIELLNQFRNKYESGSNDYNNLLQNILSQVNSQAVAHSIVKNESFIEFKEEIKKKLTIFDNKPYQLGGLDEEINIIFDILAHMNKPSVLEIGVSNGYSSAFLYNALKINGGKIVSIDLPRFAKKPQLPTDIIHQYLAKKGKIHNTGTLGDLNPGGVIPEDKYAGWLIPFNLRQVVPNITLTGNVFNIMQDLPKEKKFDFVVFDAMKGYKDRMKIMSLLIEHLNPKAIFVVDGYWVNSAFDDFCTTHKKVFWKIGRVGIFINS